VAYRAEEYVAAESLDAAIRHYAPASLDKALPFVTQLAGAIDFARAAGIGHGALHLRDIFVTPEEARASGFGVVEALERVGLRAPVRRPYSAPERIAAEQWSTPADVFSLAAITYELLTGRRPAGTGDQMGPFTGEHLREYGVGMSRVLARAMDDQPSRRYPSALAFASALEAAARGRRVTEAVATVGEIAGASRVAPVAAAPVVPAVVPVASPRVPTREPEDADAAADLPLALDRTGDADADLEYADIAAERDDDAAHYELGVAHDDDREPERSLFDDESAADLGLAPHHEMDREAAPVPPPSRLWDETADAAVEAPPRRPRERDTARYGRAPEPEPVSFPAEEDLVSEAERPRPAVLPIAVTLILGLLIGFAAGYWAGGRQPDLGTGTAATPAAAATSSTAVREGTTTPPARGNGAPSTERAAAQPPAVAPSIPDEGPRSASSERAPAPVAAPTSGRILVTSNPSSAAVTVNGRWRGRTPLTLDRMKFGPYSLRVVLPGYTVARENVTLSAANPVGNVALRLDRAAPAPETPRRAAAPARTPAAAARGANTSRSGSSSSFMGSIYVDSRPRGAQIFIDGKLAGTTPARVPDITIGSHVVRLELAEHRPWTVSTRVASGDEARVTGSLERIP
jgi:hypothetical protein